MRRRHFVAVSCASVRSAGVPSTSKANVVDRNARIMVGFPAGSSPDFVARLLAEHVKDYAPSFLVDNRPGAGGRLPLEQLKSGDRDGSLIAITPGDQVALFPHVYAKLGYDAKTAELHRAGDLRRTGHPEESKKILSGLQKLSGMTWLKRLVVSESKELPAADVEKLEKALPKCKIEH